MNDDVRLRNIEPNDLPVFSVKDRPLHAHVVKHNVGSIRVLEKCGFSVEESVEGATDGVVELALVLR